MGIIQLRAFIKKHYLFSILTGISIFLFFFELGSRSFEVWNVHRFAEIAQEMLQNGNWLIPYKHGEIYMNKPPMFMWPIALFSSPGQHVTPLTARLPGAIAGLASTLITFSFVEKFSNKRTAFIAAVVLATTQRYFWYGRTSIPDILFTTFIMLALYSFYIGYRQKKDFYIGVHFFTFLATLTKGPLAIIFIFGIIAIFLALQRDIRAMKEMKWQWGIILFITTTGLCFAFCLKVGFEPFIATIKREFLTRVNDPITHSEPFYYYFVNIWTDFLPWSLFIPFAVIFAYKKWREGDDFITFTFCWTILIFVFLCTSKAKHSRYMLPLYPAFLIIIASLIDDTLKRSVLNFSWLRVSVRWIIFVMGCRSRSNPPCCCTCLPPYVFRDWNIHIPYHTPYLSRGIFIPPLEDRISQCMFYNVHVCIDHRMGNIHSLPYGSFEGSNFWYKTNRCNKKRYWRPECL